MIFTGHYSRYRDVQEKNKVRFVARPKSLLRLFPHLKVRPPPPDPSNTYMIAECHAVIDTNAFVPTFLSLLGRSLGMKRFGS